MERARRRSLGSQGADAPPPRKRGAACAGTPAAAPLSWLPSRVPELPEHLPLGVPGELPPRPRGFGAAPDACPRVHTQPRCCGAPRARPPPGRAEPARLASPGHGSSWYNITRCWTREDMRREAKFSPPQSQARSPPSATARTHLRLVRRTEARVPSSRGLRDGGLGSCSSVLTADADHHLLCGIGPDLRLYVQQPKWPRGPG